MVTLPWLLDFASSRNRSSMDMRDRFVLHICGIAVAAYARYHRGETGASHGMPQYEPGELKNEEGVDRGTAVDKDYGNSEAAQRFRAAHRILVLVCWLADDAAAHDAGIELRPLHERRRDGCVRLNMKSRSFGASCIAA